MDGSVHCWGSNQAFAVPVTGLTSAVSQISCDENHCCGVVAAGGVQCWAMNGNGASSGQLGHNSTSSPGNFVAVTAVYSDGVTPVFGATSVSAGRYHTCAFFDGATNDRVICWGNHGERQLGDGTTVGSRSNAGAPTYVVGL